MPLWQAIILGAVQGLTEFLPISSTAHLALVPWLFGWHDPGLTFDVALHVGTLAAVLIYFWKVWMELLASSLRTLGFGHRISANTTHSEKSNPADFAANTASSLEVDELSRSDSSALSANAQQTKNRPPPPAESTTTILRKDGRLLWLLVLGTIPAALAGLLFEKQIGTTLRSPAIMGAALITIAFLMAYADRQMCGEKDLCHVGVCDALIIGCSQALALIPGVSRSGITITSALFLRFQRDAAARFSFLLSTPIIAGACVKKMLDVYHQGLAADMAAPFFLGALTSALVGYATIAFFLRFLQFGTFRIFVYYRVILGIIVLALTTFYRLNLNP